MDKAAQLGLIAPSPFRIAVATGYIPRVNYPAKRLSFYFDEIKWSAKVFGPKSMITKDRPTDIIRQSWDIVASSKNTIVVEGAGGCTNNH